MADTRCKRRKQANPKRKNVDVENMPEDGDTDHHIGMRSPSTPTSTADPASVGPEGVLKSPCSPDLTDKRLTNGLTTEEAKESIPPLNGVLPHPRKSPGEDEKIREYLQRSDTAVIYPEPVGGGAIQDKRNDSVIESRPETTSEASQIEDRSMLIGEYTLKCPHCEKAFTGTEAIPELKEHLSVVHKEGTPTLPATSKDTELPPLICPKCNATFSTKESLNKHKALHATNGQGSTVNSNSKNEDSAALRKFKCPECGKAFKFKHHLKEHIRIHSGEKPFACPNCGKRFSHSGSYSSHMTSKKCLVVNLKVRKVDTRSPRSRGPSQQNSSFRPIIPKYGSSSVPTTGSGPGNGNELPLVPAGYMPSSERFPPFLSPSRPQQPYLPLAFHHLLPSPPHYLPLGAFPEVTHLLQHRLENECSVSTECQTPSQSLSQHPSSTSASEKIEDCPETSHVTHNKEMNAVKKILEIVDATVTKQQQNHSQPQQSSPRPRNGLLSELLSSAPQSIGKVGESETFDSRCRFCSRNFDNKIDLHQHERYLCSFNTNLQCPKQTQCEQRHHENSDGESSKESSEECRSSSSVLNGDNLIALNEHYQANPRPKKSEIIRMSHDLKCPTRMVQAWFQNQHHHSKINGDSPHNSPPVLLQNSSSSPFTSVISHFNGTVPSNTSIVSYRPNILEPSQETHSNYDSLDIDQPLDLSVKVKRDDTHSHHSSPSRIETETEVLNLSQKSSRVSTPPKDVTPYFLPRPNQSVREFEKGESSPHLHSSLLYKYMQMGLPSTVRSPQHENCIINPPLAAVTPTSPERSPSQAEAPGGLPSPEAASYADNSSSPSGTLGSYSHMDDPAEGDTFSPNSSKKIRPWNQGDGDESTLEDSPGQEEDSSGGSGKMRKSWKLHKVESEEGMYACDQCDKMFSKQSSLARHKYEHSGQRPHKCDVCNKAFKHKHHLTEHKRLHSGEKPFQCKKCLKRFSHSGSYSQHMNHRYSYCKPYHD